MIQGISFDGEVKYALFEGFGVGAASGNYTLTSGQLVGGFYGNDWKYHDSMMFTTYDRDHDQNQDNCAISWNSGWWYNECIKIHLTGKYSPVEDTSRGIFWVSWKDLGKSLKEARMMMRPKM